jgi:arylsulfatase A-like enzyme
MIMSIKIIKNILIILLIIITAILFIVKKNIVISTKKLSDNYPYSSCEDCNVIIVSMTSVRPDHMSAYKYPRKTTPNIDKLTENGILFTNAFSQAARTVAGGLSLHTSQYPYTHNVMDHWFTKKNLNKKSKTLAEILKENNYKTAAFTGGGHYNGVFGFDKGFDIYEDSKIFIGIEPNIKEAVSWIEKNKNNKFYLFLQGFDAHCPYNPPSPYNEKFTNKNESDIDHSICYWSYKDTKPIKKEGEELFPLRTVINWKGTTGTEVEGAWQEILFKKQDINNLKNLYDSEIYYTDYLLKNIFDSITDLKIDDKTIIIITSDHGELLGEHGRFMRGGHSNGIYYDESIRIPLIIKSPEIKKNLKIDSLVQIIDIVPTILSFLNIPIYSEMEGKSLIPLIRGDKKEINDYIYSGTSHYRPENFRHSFNGYVESHVIRNTEWKLIKEIKKDYNTKLEETSYELYNIKNDPQEKNNLFSTEKSIFNILDKNLNDWKNGEITNTNSYQ